MFFQQVPLVINHDWEKTKVLAHRLFALKDHGVVSDFGNSTHYDFASLGSLSDHKLSKQWYRIAGPSINRSMPWLEDMLEVLRELKPDSGSISYLSGDGGEHVDLPEIPTALNYIIDSTDDEAYTWLRTNNQTFTYPSEKDKAWILNTQLPHGISNAGIRWTLSIHFDCEYGLVREWFDTHGHLVFGNKDYNGH